MGATIDRDDLGDRRLPLEGTFNLREVRDYAAGDGRRLRPGLLYRSDALHRLDAEGQRVLRERGLRTVIDLREPPERNAAPDQVDATGAAVISSPILRLGEDEEPPAVLAAVYDWILTNRGSAVADAIAVIARPGTLPALVHCAVGKDRTGVVIALLLSALGVDDDTIAADYAVSEPNLAEGAGRGLLTRPDGTPLDPIAFLADPSLARQILAHVRSSDGSVTAYLLRHGLTEQALAALGRALLVPAAGDARDGA